MKPRYEFRFEDGKSFLYLDGEKLPDQMNVIAEQDHVLAMHRLMKVRMEVLARIPEEMNQEPEDIPTHPFNPEPPIPPFPGDKKYVRIPFRFPGHRNPPPPPDPPSDRVIEQK